MAIVYKHDDAGAPAYSFTVIGNSVLNFTALKAVLRACLVDGYGSKAAAGWWLIDEGDYHIVLQPSTASGVFILHRAATSELATAYVAANFQGLDASGLPTGDGLKTGVAANNSTPQRIGTSFFARNANFHSWAVIADSKTFILNQGCYVNNFVFESGSTATDQACVALYAGEDSEGNFISVGGNNSVQGTAHSSHAQATFGHGGISTLTYPSTGLLVGSGAAVVWMPLGAMRSQAPPNRQTPSPLPDLTEAKLCKVPWFEAGIQAGYLRGVCVIPEDYDLFPAQLAQALGRSSTEGVTVSNAHQSLGFGDAYQYLPGLQSFYSRSRLITDNPDFW
jgi:subtilisin family serine protease